MRLFCDFVIFVCDFFVISRKVYKKKSAICPSAQARSLKYKRLSHTFFTNLGNMNAVL